MGAAQEPTRVWRVLALRLLGSALVLTVLLLAVPFDELVAALARVPIAVWGVAFVAYLALHLIGVTKWRLLINAAGAGLGFTPVARCYYYGLFGNLFLPSLIGGDVVRLGLALKLTRSRSGLLLGSLLDRLLDVLGLAGVAAIGAALLPRALDRRSTGIFLGLLAVVAGGAVVAVAAWFLLPALRRLPFRVRRKVVSIRQSVAALRRQPGRLVSALLLGMLLQTVQVALNAWLGDAVGIHISLAVWLFVWPLAKIAAILPVTQGGIGVREGALVILFQPFGVSAAAAMATGLIFTAVVVAGGLAGGAIAYLLGRHARLHGPGREGPVG